jgi:hypothetical protein
VSTLAARAGRCEATKIVEIISRLWKNSVEQHWSSKYLRRNTVKPITVNKESTMAMAMQKEGRKSYPWLMMAAIMMLVVFTLSTRAIAAIRRSNFTQVSPSSHVRWF